MLTDYVMKYRKIVVLFVNLFLIVAANLLAFFLRFEWRVPPEYVGMIKTTMPFIVIVRIGIFYFYEINAGLWRYVSISDLYHIIKGVVLSSVIIISCYGIKHISKINPDNGLHFFNNVNGRHKDVYKITKRKKQD